MESRIRREVYVRFGGEQTRNLPWKHGKARECLSHYDSAEGLLTAVILLLAEFLPPIEIDGQFQERRHIVSVFKLVQDLLEPSQVKGKSCFGGFAPNSKTAEELSRSLGNYTVQSGSVSRSKGENSQSLQMVERALMTPDELKSIPKGEFVVMKTGSHKKPPSKREIRRGRHSAKDLLGGSV